ncbi:MAG: DoxX family protein [Ilumatobacteraceae bacterium]
MRDEVFLLGRIVFSLVLLRSAFGHLTQTEASAGYAQFKGGPNAKTMVQVTGVLMGLGGAAVVLGIFMDLAAVLIAVLMVIFAVKMHDFWKVTDPQAQAGERAQFMKNISIAGGALVIAAVTTDFTPYTLTDAIF